MPPAPRQPATGAPRPTPFQKMDATLAALVDQLPGVTARIQVHAMPLVISGKVDGRGFYLRVRHGTWQVVVATGATSHADPWEHGCPEETVATGDVMIIRGDDDDYVLRAMQLALHTVRSHLRRQAALATANATRQELADRLRPYLNGAKELPFEENLELHSLLTRLELALQPDALL